MSAPKQKPAQDAEVARIAGRFEQERNEARNERDRALVRVAELEGKNAALRTELASVKGTVRNAELAVVERLEAVVQQVEAVVPFSTEAAQLRATVIELLRDHAVPRIRF